jgi:hypothetical protein
MADWLWADAFLKGGRKKYERPLYDRSLRIWKENKWDADSPISIGWKYGGSTNSFVTYYKDGTTTINGEQTTTHWGGVWSPLRSHSVRLTIHRYAGIQVVQRNFKFYLQEDGASLTSPKIQGCRTCKQTGLVDLWCYSQTCYKVERDGEKVSCPEHPDMDITRAWGMWHTAPCEHGLVNPHNVPRAQTCHSCNGTKKRDYGSKPKRTLWDGSPLRLRDGQIINAIPTALERMIADYVQPIS